MCTSVAGAQACIYQVSDNAVQRQRSMLRVEKIAVASRERTKLRLASAQARILIGGLDLNAKASSVCGISGLAGPLSHSMPIRIAACPHSSYALLVAGNEDLLDHPRPTGAGHLERLRHCPDLQTERQRKSMFLHRCPTTKRQSRVLFCRTHTACCEAFTEK